MTYGVSLESNIAMQLLVHFFNRHCRLMPNPALMPFNDEKLARRNGVNSHDLLLRRRMPSTDGPCEKKRLGKALLEALPGPRCIEKYCCSAHAATIVLVGGNEPESLKKFKREAKSETALPIRD